jgi:hypothetical protein
VYMCPDPIPSGISCCSLCSYHSSSSMDMWSTSSRLEELQLGLGGLTGGSVGLTRSFTEGKVYAMSAAVYSQSVLKRACARVRVCACVCACARTPQCSPCAQEDEDNILNQHRFTPFAFACVRACVRYVRTHLGDPPHPRYDRDHLLKQRISSII